MAAIRTLEASSSTSPCSYHVFLSFPGEDTRKSFTDHLYTALNYAGFRTVRDDDGIERGEKIKPELQKAIKESRMSIIVLSKNYASSSWCLDELVMILKCKSTSGHVILLVFYDVIPSQVRNQVGRFEEAFTRHEGKIEAESGERRKEWTSKVGEWRAALREVAGLAGMNLQNRADGHESSFIQTIIKVVGDKLSRTILDITPYAIGIHSRSIKIQLWLEDGSTDVGVASICGMGGIGKTTIAKFLYNLNFSGFYGSSLHSVDESNKVVMHHLLQEMGREIVCQESPNEAGERRRLSNHKDSFDGLRHNTVRILGAPHGTRKIEGLILDMSLLKEHKSTRKVFGVNRKRSLEEFLDNSLMSNVGNLLKRLSLGIFFRNSDIVLGDSNIRALETNAFAKMVNLKLLQLCHVLGSTQRARDLGVSTQHHVRINGSYENLPKKIRWLCWHGFPLDSIPSYFPSEALVALEMPYSRLKNFWDRTKFLELLKILNLRHSHSLTKTPDFIALPDLERLILEDCTRLVEIHDSAGHLARLVLLDLKDCSNLRKLPRSIGTLKSLETLDISGCSNLENLPTEMGNLDSLTVLRAENVTGMTQSPATIQNVKAWYSFIWLSPLKPKRNAETSWASSLPRSLVKQSLVRCNLSDDAFPTDLGNLFSLVTPE